MPRTQNKVGDPIQVVYQAPGRASGETVNMQIYDESGSLDAVNFPDVTMVEVGSSGRYRGSFTPDAEGNWEVHISLSDGRGGVVHQFQVMGYNIDGIGTIVTDIQTIVDGIDSPPMVG